MTRVLTTTERTDPDVSPCAAGLPSPAPSLPVVSASCPRCGYDLRGVMSTWQTACPVTGVCTECGLDFAWAELLNRALVPPAWHVESPLGQHRFPRRVVGTLWRSIVRPYRHWRSLKMSHHVCWASITGYLLTLVFLVYLCTAAATALVVMGEARRAQTPFEEQLKVAILAFLWPVTPESLAITPPAPVSWWQPRGRAWTTAPLMHFSRIGTSVGLGAGTAIIQFLVIALVFLALPITRRRCKVRMEHVWRIAALGVAIWAPALMLFAFTEPASMLSTPWPRAGSLTDLLIKGGTVLTSALSFLWWVLAVRWYLRMTHAFWVAILACAAGLLASTTLILYTAIALRGWW